MRSKSLAIPLLFSSFVACSVPAQTDEPGSPGAWDLSKEDPRDPNSGGVDQPQRCGKATGTIFTYPGSITLGGSTTVSWSVTLPRGCDIAPTMNSQTVELSGSRVVSPKSSQDFVLQLNGKTLARTSVSVTLPSTVHISGNTTEWRDLLAQAVGTPNTRVVLDPGVDLNMAGRENIRVAQGVTLTSEKPFELMTTAMAFKWGGDFRIPTQIGRDPHTPGPRLYTTDRPKALFLIECQDPAGIWGNDVKFEGFRLEGPHQDTMDGDDNLERGIEIVSCLNVELSNLELSGFSGAAVHVQDPKFWQIGAAVKVHDSYIHNNQHVGGNGYGVDVGAGASVRIERNVFDLNRHAIAASGKPGTSYVADHNLVLKGGGVHDKWYNHYTHLFDVHGDDNCDYLPGDWSGHIWNCGNAGDDFVYTDNAFQYTNDHAIKLRGVPRHGASFRGNVFAHDDDYGDAIETFDDTNIIKGPNETGFDSFGKYGVCDFDGDGKDDLFLATGASWWFSSGGNNHWTYLSSNRERLGDVALGDFDGDKRCDVFSVNKATGAWQLSKGGTAAWTPLPYSVPFDQLRFGDFNGDKVIDVFRAAPDGQWWAVSPGVYDWKALQSSSIPVTELRFGDFDGDGLTDVLKRGSAGYEISSGAVSTWKPWGTLRDDPRSFLVADVDGVPGDDLLRFASGRWEVSSQGRAPFVALAAGASLGFVGRFKGGPKADLIGVDSSRLGKIFSVGATGFIPYGRYPY